MPAKARGEVSSAINAVASALREVLMHDPANNRLGNITRLNVEKLALQHGPCTNSNDINEVLDAIDFGYLAKLVQDKQAAEQGG